MEVHAHNKYWVPYIFETIQEAVNYATDGDEIVVAAGTYNGSVVLNKSVALWSYEFQKAVIVGDEYSEAVTIQADNAVLWGFNIISTGIGVGLHSCSGVRVTGNLINAGLGEGILVEGGGSNSIVNNYILPCTYYGMELLGTNGNLIMANSMDAHGSAVCMTRSCFNHIIRNNLGVHQVSPICVLQLLLSNSNIVEENTLSSLTTWAPSTQFWNARDNSFFHNNFLHLLQGLDIYGECTDNRWDNGSEGNYWWDYEGSDSDGDGIGDTPYVIEGNLTDGCPFMKPYSWWNIADLNRDWKVDIFDVVQLCGDYGATVLASDWSFLCDIAEPWGAIDIYDLVTIASNYGKTRPST